MRRTLQITAEGPHSLALGMKFCHSAKTWSCAKLWDTKPDKIDTVPVFSVKC